MKPRSRTILGVAGLAVITLSAVPRVLGVMGVADTTIIAGDMTDMWKWPRELAQWTSLIQSTREQVQKADRLIALAGDPQQFVNEFVESVPELMAPIDDAIGLETRQEALRFSRELYSLGSVAVQTYDDAKKVGPRYEAFGETVRRDPSRYARYVFEEALNARYKKAVENVERVEKKEMALMEKYLRQLKTAHTASEIALVDAAMTASKQRLEVVQQKAAQAKAELEAFHGELLVEDARKDEADREWAHAVIDRMREKALAAYRAQFPGAEDDS